MRAFKRLRASRSSTMSGPGLVPFEAVAAYADRYGISDRAAFQRFDTLIHALDASEIADQRNQQGA